MIRMRSLPSGFAQALIAWSAPANWRRATPRRASASCSSSMGGGRSVGRAVSEGARTPGGAKGSGPRADTDALHWPASERRSRSIQYQAVDNTMTSPSCSSRTATAWRRAARRFSYSRWKTAIDLRCSLPRIFGPVVRASSR